MPSTSDLVESHLKGDMIIERALGRGVLNLRRAARWLIEHHGWDTSESAVVSALRRYEPPKTHTPIDEGYELLRLARTGVKTGWGLVETPATDAVRERIREALEPHAGPVGVLQGTDTVTYLVREPVAVALEEDHSKDLEAVHKPVSQVQVELSQDDPATALALNILLYTLTHRGVHLLGVFSSAGEYSLLVPGRFTDEVHDVLLHLRDDRSSTD